MIGALMLLGTGLEAAGQIYAGNAAEELGQQNAAILRGNAQLERQQGGQREEALRRKQAMFLANQRAGFAQSGMDSTSGSAADIQFQSEVFAELDAMTVRYESQMRALGLLQQADQAIEQGKAAKTASMIGAGASLLSGFGNYKMATAGT